MRAIGFSEYTDRKKLKELLTDVIMNSDHRAYTMNQEGILLGEFSKNHTATRGAIESGTFGVAVCGEFDDNDKFIYEYYYPSLTGSGITSYEDVSVERHAEKDSYAGICDDIKVGISLIFYLRNRIPYIKAQSTRKLPIRGTTLTLSGLSLTGSILLPIKKDEEQVLRVGLVLDTNQSCFQSLDELLLTLGHLDDFFLALCFTTLLKSLVGW